MSPSKCKTILDSKISGSLGKGKGEDLYTAFSSDLIYKSLAEQSMMFTLIILPLGNCSSSTSHPSVWFTLKGLRQLDSMRVWIAYIYSVSAKDNFFIFFWKIIFLFAFSISSSSDS